MITPINQTTTNYYNHKPCRVNFQGYNPAQFAAPAERSLRNIEFAGRKIINIFFDFFNKNKYNLELRGDKNVKSISILLCRLR